MRKLIVNGKWLIGFVFLVSCLSALAQTPSETPPPPSDPRSVSIPQVKEMTLPNGLKVVVVQKRNLPLVTVSLLVKNGAFVEDNNKAGLANLTADLLLKGTEFRTASDIAQQIDFLGGDINSSASWTSSTINLNIMNDKLGKALAIMSDSVIRPTFPEKELQLSKKQALDGFDVSLKQPGTLLNYVATNYTYNEHPSNGLPQTISKIRRNDVVSFHRENYVPGLSVLIFTGDISPDQAFRFAKLYFGGWQPPTYRKELIANIYETPPPDGITIKADSDGEGIIPEKTTFSRMLVIDLPNSGQAAVGFATKVDVGRSDCDMDENDNLNCKSTDEFYPASVLNSVLGGGYSSRLNQEIRLKRGLSYGAGSRFGWRDWDSTFMASAQTKNESAAEVAELIKIEMDKLANDDVSNDEMIPRKAVVTGNFSRGLQSNEDLAARLRDLYLFQISPDELNSFIGDVGNVTDEQVRNFASNNLLGGDMIIVGDAKKFMDDLKKRFPKMKIEVIKSSDLDLSSPNLKKKGK